MVYAINSLKNRIKSAKNYVNIIPIGTIQKYLWVFMLKNLDQANAWNKLLFNGNM